MTSFAAAASISTPPAVEVNAIAFSAAPCVFVTTIVSDVPRSVVREIAEAASSFDTRATCPPVIATSLPLAASIFILRVLLQVRLHSHQLPVV